MDQRSRSRRIVPEPEGIVVYEQKKPLYDSVRRALLIAAHEEAPSARRETTVRVDCYAARAERYNRCLAQEFKHRGSSTKGADMLAASPNRRAEIGLASVPGVKLTHTMIHRVMAHPPIRRGWTSLDHLYMTQ